MELTINGVKKTIAAPSKDELARSEASVVEGPKRRDGSVDYLEAINSRMSRGVTAENNAMVMFVRASDFESRDGLGMDKFSEKNDVEFLKRLQATSGEAPFVPFRPRTSQLDAMFTFAQNHPWNKTDFPEIEHWFQLNSKSMMLVRKGLELSEFYYPVVSDRYPSLISQSRSNYRHIRDFAQHILIGGYRKLHDSQIEDCIADIGCLFRLADFVGRGLSLQDGLTARSFFYQACRLSASLCASQKASSEQLRTLANLVQKNTHVDGLANAIDIGERWLALEVIEYLERGSDESDLPGLRLPRSYRKSIDWKEVKTIVNSKFDRVAAAAKMKDTAERLAFSEYVSVELSMMETQKRNNFSLLQKFSLSKADKTRLVAGDLVKMLLEPAMACFESAANSESRKQMTLLVIAITRYQMEHAKLPSNLESLSPKYLDVVPLDANTNRPFRYVVLESGYRVESTKWEYPSQLPDCSVTPRVRRWDPVSGQ